MDSLTLARDGRREAVLSLAGSLLAWGGWLPGRLALVVSLSGSGDGGQAWREQADRWLSASSAASKLAGSRPGPGPGRTSAQRPVRRTPRGQVAGRDDQVVTVRAVADVPGQRQLVPLRGGDRAGLIAAADGCRRVRPGHGPDAEAVRRVHERPAHRAVRFTA